MASAYEGRSATSNRLRTKWGKYIFSALNVRFWAESGRMLPGITQFLFPTGWFFRAQQAIAGIRGRCYVISITSSKWSTRASARLARSASATVSEAHQNCADAKPAARLRVLLDGSRYLTNIMCHYRFEHTALTSRPLSRYWIQKIFSPVLPTGSRAQKARLYLGVFSLEQESE